MKIKKLLKNIQYFYENYFNKIEKGYLLKPHIFYKIYLRIFQDFKSLYYLPIKIPWMNTTLKNKSQVEKVIKIVRYLKLNYNRVNIEKNWDSLIVLNIILKNRDRSIKILDAGGELNSLILHWLYQFGYYNLKCINLVFNKNEKRGRIEFIHGNLTKTPFNDNYFDVITCISVIEHGVNDEKYFNEMFRILKKGGLLITSTDYWETKIFTNNQYAYNNPVFIHDKNSINKLLNVAYSKGFKLYGPEIDLSCQDKVVNWKIYYLKFTFLVFCLQKV